MTAAIDEQAFESRKQTRRAWWFVAALTGGIIVICGFLFFQDVDPPDDADMMPMFTEGGGANNPLKNYLEQIKELPKIKWTELSVEARELKPGSEEELRNFHQDHEDHLKAFIELTSSEYNSWRWRLTDDGEINARMDLSYLVKVNFLANLVSSKSIVLTRDGKHEEALDLAIRLLQMGYGMERAEGVFLHLLVSITMQAIAYNALEYAVSFSDMNDESALLRVESVLNESDHNRLSGIQNILKSEYLFAKNSNVSREQIVDIYGKSGLEVWMFDLQYKPNRSLQTSLVWQRPLVQSFNHSFPQVLEEIEVQRQTIKNWRADKLRILNANAGGNFMIAESLTSFQKILERVILTEIRSRLLRAQLAVRRFKLQNGKLPADLNELVPQYLNELPLDPADDKPLRYDISREVVYSISIDRMDDGGNFTDKMDFKGDDYGLYYPWGDSAKKLRDEKYGP